MNKSFRKEFRKLSKNFWFCWNKTCKFPHLKCLMKIVQLQSSVTNIRALSHQEKNTKNVQAIETPYIFAQIPCKHFAKKCFYSVKKNTQIMHGKQTWTHIPSKNLGLPQQNSFSRKIAKFREKVCGIHKKICAFFLKKVCFRWKPYPTHNLREYILNFFFYIYLGTDYTKDGTFFFMRNWLFTI